MKGGWWQGLQWGVAVVAGLDGQQLLPHGHQLLLQGGDLHLELVVLISLGRANAGGQNIPWISQGW